MANTVKLPIFNPVYRNVDEVELQDRQALLMNGYLSELDNSLFFIAGGYTQSY